MIMDELLAGLPPANRLAIEKLRREKELLLTSAKKGIRRFREPYEAVRDIRATHCDFSGETVSIGEREELEAADHRRLDQTLRAFMPWRKGPFRVFGIEIDAEWRSERKWRRLEPFLPPLQGKTVADIGANNGYYMFRLAHHQPRRVIGFEPYLQHYFAFQTLNRLAGQENLHLEPLGVEHFGLFADSFDLVLLLGIIYHRSSPLEVLREIKTGLRPGGTLIVESQAIPGQDQVALFPARTYAKAPGTYFVPTGPCLANWLSRAGFEQVELFCSHPMSSAEQRRTDWMTFESYADFLDPADSGRTVEGYPAPWRVFLRARNPA